MCSVFIAPVMLFFGLLDLVCCTWILFGVFVGLYLVVVAGLVIAKHLMLC